MDFQVWWDHARGMSDSQWAYATKIPTVFLSNDYDRAAGGRFHIRLTALSVACLPLNVVGEALPIVCKFPRFLRA